VPLGRADLLFDQVEIIEEPFAGRGDAAIGSDRFGEQLADVFEDFFVLGEAGQQLVGRAARRQAVRGSERPAVLLHLVGAVELRSQRRFFARVLRERIGAAEARDYFQQSIWNLSLDLAFISREAAPAATRTK
jgi:hypothetical protein